MHYWGRQWPCCDNCVVKMLLTRKTEKWSRSKPLAKVDIRSDNCLFCLVFCLTLDLHGSNDLRDGEQRGHNNRNDTPHKYSEAPLKPFETFFFIYLLMVTWCHDTRQGWKMICFPLPSRLFSQQNTQWPMFKCPGLRLFSSAWISFERNVPFLILEPWKGNEVLP